MVAPKFPLESNRPSGDYWIDQEQTYSSTSQDLLGFVPPGCCRKQLTHSTLSGFQQMMRKGWLSMKRVWRKILSMLRSWAQLFQDLKRQQMDLCCEWLEALVLKPMMLTSERRRLT